jgi:hypothetical protein
MIIDISKEVITNELLQEGQKWFWKDITKKTMKNSTKYLVLNWDNLSVEQFLTVLPNLDENHINNYLNSGGIKDKDILLNMFKHIETENEEYLWNGVVDTRYISDEVYQKNTYEENFDIWFKMNSDSFEGCPEANPEHSYTSFKKAVEAMDAKSPKQLKEEQRRDRVCNWLDSIISISYTLEDFSDVKDYLNDRIYVEFLFKKGNFVPSPSLSFFDLEKLPTHKQAKYSIDLMGKTAFSATIEGKSSFSNASMSREMFRLLQKANLPQSIDKYIKFWVKDRVGEINPRK